MTRIAALGICTTFLAGCAITVPVAVLGSNGEVMHGTATASSAEGTFQVSGPLGGKRLTCSGTYDPWDRSETITMSVACDDGRTGQVLAVRDATGANGSGTVTLNDGTTALLVFGRDARNY